MKKKKLFLAALLSLFMVTGGVYGAWTYYTGDVTTSSKVVNPSIEIKTDSSARGAISLTTEDLAIKIEPTADKTNYKAILDVTGSIVAKYTPTAGSVQGDFKGLVAKFEFTNSNYLDTPIFTKFDTKEITTIGTEDTLTINASNLKSKIILGEFTLSTKEEALAFQTALENLSIKITISEKTGQ